MPAPLVLLPGLICDARIFAAQQERFRCLAIDGFGPLTSIKAMACNVLDTGPARMSLLGHSMAGRVALEVWRAAPERIERLGLISTGVHMVQPGEAGKRFALRDVGRAQGFEALVDQWLTPMVSPAARQTPALMTELRTMCLDAGQATFEAQITALLTRPEVESLLPAINCPVLVATGALDVWSPPEQHRAMASALPNAMLRIVEGSGHMLPAEAPQAFNDIIAEWLARPA